MSEIDLKQEFISVARAYFMPVTFIWVLCTRGWPAARRHCVEGFRLTPPPRDTAERQLSPGDDPENPLRTKGGGA